MGKKAGIWVLDEAVKENQEVKADKVLKQIAELKANEDRWSVNEAIASLIWGEPIIRGNAGGIKTLYWDCQNGMYLAIPPDFTGSLDAAITLFHPKLYQISTNPRIACIEAICHRFSRPWPII